MKQTSEVQERERLRNVTAKTPFSDSGPLWNALGGALQLLASDPAETERQVLAVLKLAPGLQQALQLLVDGRRAQGDSAGARVMLDAMAAETPELATVHFELGMLLAELGEIDNAIRSLSRVVELEPKHPQAWRALGDAFAQAGNMKDAANAYGQQVASSIMDLKTLEQVAAMGLEQAEIAEGVLREYLSVYPTDLTALEMLASLHLRAGEFEAAESMFTRALELAPPFQKARLGLVSALRQQMKSDEECRQYDILLGDDADNLEFRELKTLALSASGKIQDAVADGEELIRADPERPRSWLAYAHVLRTAGRQQDCIHAYRKAVELDPELYEAWWGLANLKTFRFAPADVEMLQNERDPIGDGRAFRHFALGKAFEDRAAYGEAFEQFRQGNALIRAENPYDFTEVKENVQREKRRFTREFFAAHKNEGTSAAGPIFILGLPRSGSTLVEQILASHSMVEGCGELPALASVVRRLRSTRDKDGQTSDDAEVYFRGENLKALGEEYLERAKSHRKLPRPYFTDKMPSNFHHLGVLCATLPNAKIIDARRHPLDCCVSNFKQIFPNRHDPSYDLADIGRYYCGYVELMAHFDRILPGRIQRVIYEDLVQDPEREIRRLLDYCELPFEDACLRFYETERGIRTISSEQVRKPVYTDSVAQWRRYDPWLAPLKDALGPVLDAYPAVPEI